MENILLIVATSYNKTLDVADATPNEATFDWWDLLAYISFLFPLFLLDYMQQNNYHNKKP